MTQPEFHGEEVDAAWAQYLATRKCLLIAAANTANPFQVQPAPFTLSPWRFQREAFEQARSVMATLNKLVDSISRQPDILYSWLEDAAQVDPFTARLVDISKKSHSEGAMSKWVLGVHRSDYMLQQLDTGYKCLQVEINTISVAFPALSTKVNEFHHTLYPSLDIPISESLKKIPQAIFRAHELFLLNKPVRSTSCPAVLVVVQEGERNSVDQMLLGDELAELGVKTIRRTLTDIHLRSTFESDHSLVIDGHLITVVYFRAGYTPKDYPSEQQWEARQKIETSRAIKCPNVDYQLAGTKKVQQMLYIKENLYKFLGREEADELHKLFAEQLSFETNTKDVIDRILQQPDVYIMKPQREGGGNLVHGEEMVKLLKQEDHSQLRQYIAMRRIESPPVSSTFVRDGIVKVVDAVTEFGAFGVFLGNGEIDLLNTYAGHLLRTKSASQADGGVVSGVACLDSACLI